jgi:hypothetical protein
MTIRTHINPRALSTLLEEQPEELVAPIGALADEIIRQTRALGLNAPNCDPIREVECVIFRYLRDANPGHFIEPAVPSPSCAPRIIPHPNFTQPGDQARPIVNASTDLPKYLAELAGRQAVNAAWLAAHPDVSGYLYTEHRERCGEDPWTLIDGAEQMRDGTVTLHYGRAGEKNVPSDFEVYVARRDTESNEPGPSEVPQAGKVNAS